MKLNVKFLLIFSLLLLSLILFAPGSQAAFNFSCEGVEYSLPDLPEDSNNFDKNHFSIFKGGKSSYTLLSYLNFDVSTMKICNTNSEPGYMGIVDYNGSPQRVARIVFWDFGSGVWELAGWQPGSGIYQYYTSAETSDKFIYSTDNIYLATGNDRGFSISDSFFFPGAVPQVPMLKTVAEIPVVMVEVAKVIIPVSLTLLSMVLVISLILLVVSRHR